MHHRDIYDNDFKTWFKDSLPALWRDRSDLTASERSRVPKIASFDTFSENFKTAWNVSYDFTEFLP